MGGDCSATVSFVLSLLSEDVCVVFSFEASMLSGSGDYKCNGAIIMFCVMFL